MMVVVLDGVTMAWTLAYCWNLVVSTSLRFCWQR